MKPLGTTRNQGREGVARRSLDVRGETAIRETVMEKVHTWTHPRKPCERKVPTGGNAAWKNGCRQSRPCARLPLGSTVKLPLDWNEFIGLSNSHHVRFLIVGAHALAANGRPRATQDLDIFVEPALDNARRPGEALAEFGFPALAREWRRMCERS